MLADEEAFLVHVIYIVSADLVFFYFLADYGKVGLIATSGIRSVPCKVDVVEVSSVKPVLVSRDEARSPVLLKPSPT